MFRTVVIACALLFVLAACQAQTSSSETQAASEPAATSSSTNAASGTTQASADASQPETRVVEDGEVRLVPEDVVALANIWQGGYIIKRGGFEGRSILTLSNPNPEDGTIQGVFEYRWGSGNRSQYPESGTVEGVINDGELHFGSWHLVLEREDNRYKFKEPSVEIGRKPASIWWYHDGPLALAAASATQ